MNNQLLEMPTIGDIISSNMDSDEYSSVYRYAIIGGIILLSCVLCWAAEWIIYCATCKFCRKWYKRIRCLFYYLMCCCLCSKKPIKSNALEYIENK